MKTFVPLLVALCVIFGFLENQVWGQNPTPDIIFHNGTVLTMESEQPQAQAVAIAGDRIIAVGTDQEVLALQGAQTQVIDLGGKTLMPGFVDAHTHIFNDAEAYMGLSLEQAQQLALENGITTLADMYVTEAFLQQMQEFEQQGDLKIRTSLYLVYTTNCGEIVGDWYKTYPPSRNFGEMLRIGGVKIFTDGGSCGLPGVTFEYNNIGGHGDIFFTQEKLNQAVADIHQNGYQVVIHALGDSAVILAQNAIAAALDGQPNTLRHRIDHNSIIRPDLLSRYNEIGIIPSVFGYISTCRENSDGVWEWYLGAERLSWVRPNRALLDANPGLPVAWHGDDPWVGPISPLLELYSLVTRKEVAEDGVSVCEPPDWMTQNVISVQEALQMMTINAAYALFRENEVGSLKPGKLADMIILSDNPLTIDPDDIKDLKVLMTIVGGVVEYCAPGQGSLCAGFQQNLALNKPVTASKSLTEHPPEMAVDGALDTYWGSGDFPPQWIEIDLQESFSVESIRLVVDQFPNGETRHKVWGKGPEAGANYQLLHEFSGFTTYGQVLSYSPSAPWSNIRYIKVETVQSPSWVSWKEVELVNTIVTGISSPDGSVAPTTFELFQNYPNPFNPGTTIGYRIQQRGRVQIRIYNSLGEVVRKLVDEIKPEGVYRVVWDGKDSQGRLLPSGVYYYEMMVGDYAGAKRMILLK